MATGLRIIPRFSLQIEQMLRRAESRGDLVTYPSLIKGAGYVTDLEDILIITKRGGYLRLPASTLKDLLQEIEYINEDIERRKRD